MPVSIHASVKDATPAEHVLEYRAREVSIHASVKDATMSNQSPADSDMVSIHASVKDATRQKRH